MIFMVVYSCLFFISNVFGNDLSIWELLAHGSDRSEYMCNNCEEWTVTTDLNYNLINWEVPFEFSPTLPGGIAQRVSDGHIHFQLLGTVRNNLGPEIPGGGSTKGYGPPYIWEINPIYGNTVGLYDLSQYGTTFYSIVRYTPNDMPIVAVCSKGSNSYNFNITIIELNNMGNVTWEFKPSLEPMLIQITNTDPQELLYSGMYSVGMVTFNDTNSLPNKNEVTNNYMSTIIFGTDGETLYNDGFANEYVGIYKMKIPFTSSTKEIIFYDGCETFPWLMASNNNNELFVACNYGGANNLVKLSNEGKVLWDKSIYLDWLILNDDESVIITGSTKYWHGYNADTGDMIFNTTLLDITTQKDNELKCYESAQPWASRFPITVPNIGLIILCSNSNGYNVRILDISNGKMIGIPIIFTIPHVSIMIADKNSVYGFGNNNGKVSAQRLNLPLK